MSNKQPDFNPGALEFGATASGVASGDVCWDLLNANTWRIGLTRLEIILAAATASFLGLGKPATVGTQTSPFLGISVGLLSPNTSGDAALIGTSWSAQPTWAGVQFIRRTSLAAAVGASVLWTWPEDNPLVILPGESVALRNAGGGAMAAASVNARWLSRVPAV